MNKSSARPEVTSQKIGRFVLTGGLVTGIHVLVAFSFLNFVAPVPTLANGIAFLVATSFSYLINTLWTFSDSLVKQNMVRFGVVSAICAVLAVVVSGGAEFYGLSHGADIALVVLTLPPVSFLLHNFWTYNETGNETGKKS